MALRIFLSHLKLRKTSAKNLQVSTIGFIRLIELG
ncbi:hypothetical protein HKBW3S03_01003, partial [Candidatus Hakubella thermalkaliphila]